MSEMEAEALAKLVELEGELVQVKQQKKELEEAHNTVIFILYIS